jgi:hypothetical protein
MLLESMLLCVHGGLPSEDNEESGSRERHSTLQHWFLFFMAIVQLLLL